MYAAYLINMNFNAFVLISLLTLVLVQADKTCTTSACRAEGWTPCSPYKIVFYSNKDVEIYIGGEEVPHKREKKLYSVEVNENTCDDILFVIDNDVHADPIAVSAIMYSGDEKYATSLFIKGNSSDPDGEWTPKYAHVKYAEQEGVKPLFGIATDKEFDKTSTTIDFSGWRQAGIVDSVLKTTYPRFGLLREQGAFPLHVNDGPMKVNTYGLKLCNPLGHATSDAQTVVSACYNL